MLSRGSCFCGEVEIEAEGNPLEMGYCHCNSCRAYSGAMFGAYILWPAEEVKVVEGAQLVGRYNKVGATERRFCTRCGGHLMSHHPALGVTDVRAGAMPGVSFRPTVHLNYSEAMMRVKDGLAKLKDFPARVGGSGELVPE